MDRVVLLEQIAEVKGSIAGTASYCFLGNFSQRLDLLKKLQDVRAQNIDLTTENQILAEYLRQVQIRAITLS